MNKEKELLATKCFLPVDIRAAAVQEKLQADNRQQALCKAVKLGLVFPTVYYENDAETAHFFLGQKYTARRAGAR